MIDEQQHQEFYQDCLPLLEEIVQQEQLGEDILQTFSDIHLHLAAWVASKHDTMPVVIGINGAQGSGKSTLSHILQRILRQAFGKSVINLSIDDLYLSRQYREKLADEIHPLLNVRGVPGTHDIELGHNIFTRLLNPTADFSIQLPKFNKAEDDLYPEAQWQVITEAPDIILFEGWCVGAQAQHESELVDEVNELEKNEDPDGSWRSYVNQQLAEEYQSLFSYIDYTVMLKVPDMDSVFEWRNLQEQKLVARCEAENKSTSHLMSETEISRFIMHYERITRATLQEMPDRSDIALELNKDHQVEKLRVKGRK